MSAQATISSNHIAIYNSLSVTLEKIVKQITVVNQKISQVNIENRLISSKAVNVISVRVGKINAKLQESEKKTQSWAEKISAASGKVQKGFSTLNGWFGGKLSLTAMAKSAGELQTLQQRIKGLPQVFCDSADGIYFLTQEANKARMPMKAYGDAYVALAKNSKSLLKSPKAVTDTLNAMSNALRLGTGSSEEQASALSALSSSFKKGKIDAEAMGGFLSKLSEKTLGDLAHGIGMSSKQLLAMAKQGKITGVQLEQGLKKAAPSLQKGVDSLPMKWDDAVTKVGNRWDELLFALENKSGLITKISNLFIKGFDLVERSIDWLIVKCGGVDNALMAIGSIIGAVFAGKTLLSIISVISWLGKAWPVLSTLLSLMGKFGPVMTIARAGLMRLIPALASISWPLTLLIGLVIALYDAYRWISGEDSYIGSLIGPWENYLASLMQVWEGIKAVFSGIGEMGQGIGEIFSGLFEMDGEKIKAGFEQLFSGLMTVVDGFAEMAKGAFDYIVDPFMAAGSKIMGWLGFGDDEEKAEEPAGKSAGDGVRNVSRRLAKPEPGLQQMVADGNLGLPNLSAAQTVAVTTSNQSSITSNQQINLQVTASSPQELASSLKEAVVKGAEEGNRKLVRDVNGGMT